jgi:putative ABC transport system permease protein
VIAGDPADLDDTGIVVNDEWADHTVGDRIDVWLGDGTRATLRVVAVIRAGTGDNGVSVTRHNGAGAPTDRLDIRWAPGSDAAAGESAVRTASRSAGARVFTRTAWIAAASPSGSRQTRVGFLMSSGSPWSTPASRWPAPW